VADAIEETDMTTRLLSLFAGVAFLVTGATGAFAHALLHHAAPGVGATVNTSPNELQIIFSAGVVASFSGATLATAEGAAIPTGKAVVNASAPETIHVPIGRALKPGTYVVTWHVVSVDAHKTSGSYKFTLAP
jgi:copper resistance protein C